VIDLTVVENETLERTEYRVWPKGSARPVPPEVEERYERPFRQASTVMADSPEASAALSRRCLQDLLREKVGVKPQNLDKEIDELLTRKELPSWLADDVDAIRQVGNFAAHPIKSTSTGEVVEVEPGEAEWLLDVLEGLFDFYFVQPERAATRRKTFEAKLTDANKPPLKTST
jgi:Domain of unknown function (DUF4145)